MTPTETAGRAGKGEDGRAGTREAKLACLFTQSRVDKDGYPVRDPGSSSYLATLDPVTTFAGLLDAEARRRGAEHIRQLIVLGDGAHWIWNLADQHFPAATQIVDLYHAREHLHALAEHLAFIITDPPTWLAQRLSDLDNGDIDAICAAAHVYPPRRCQSHRTRQGPGLLSDQRAPHALRPLPSAGHVRRLRRRGSRLQNRPRRPPQTIRHALVHPRCHRHHDPALPTRQ